MPFVSIDHFADLAVSRCRELQKRLGDAVVEVLNLPPSQVRVFTRAVSREEVYMADGQTENGLPVIRVEYVGAIALERKRRLVAALAEVAAAVLEVPVARVRTILFEQEPTDWARGTNLVVDE